MQITVGQTDVKVYFYPKQTDGKTPALFEEGGQPQIAIGGNPFSNTGISTLVHLGFGRYYATLDPIYITNVGDVILSRYKSAGTTETEGTPIIEVVGTPAEPGFNSMINESYMTVEEANNFFNNRLRTATWTDSSYEDRRKSLIQATARIDRLNFAGSLTNVNQVLQFPRGTDTVIPNDIKVACALIAIRLLDEIEIDKEIENTMLQAGGYHQARTQYDRSFIQEHVLAGIPSAEAWQFLKPYLASSREITLVKT